MLNSGSFQNHPVMGHTKSKSQTSVHVHLQCFLPFTCAAQKVDTWNLELGSCKAHLNCLKSLTTQYHLSAIYGRYPFPIPIQCLGTWYVERSTLCHKHRNQRAASPAYQGTTTTTTTCIFPIVLLLAIRIRAMLSAVAEICHFNQGRNRWNCLNWSKMRLKNQRKCGSFKHPSSCTHMKVSWTL